MFAMHLWGGASSKQQEQICWRAESTCQVGIYLFCGGERGILHHIVHENGLNQDISDLIA